MLKVPGHVLDAIGYTHGQQPIEALHKVFEEWQQRRCTDCNWKSILRMLTSSSVGRRDIAYIIIDTF